MCFCDLNSKVEGDGKHDIGQIWDECRQLQGCERSKHWLLLFFFPKLVNHIPHGFASNHFMFIVVISVRLLSMNLYWKVEDSFVFMASYNFCKFFVTTIWHGVLSRTEKTEPN